MKRAVIKWIAIFHFVKGASENNVEEHWRPYFFHFVSKKSLLPERNFGELEIAQALWTNMTRMSQELYQINCFDKLLVRLFRQQLILLFCKTLNVNFFHVKCAGIVFLLLVPLGMRLSLVAIAFSRQSKVAIIQWSFSSFHSLLLCGKGMRFGEFKTTYLYFSKFVLTAVQFKYEVNHMKFYYS